jgi:glycosyltransferase involved in cell wall biosynthesis
LTFSVCIPVYDHIDYLGTALESVRCQPADVQLAVLDASPDDSAQNVLGPYRDMIHFAYHHSDAGQAAAIQEGWDKTSGDIVAWLNVDDYYFPQAFAKVRQIFAERPDVDVVYGHGVHVSTDGSFEMYFPAISEDPAQLRRGCIICQPACFLRRNVLQRVGELNVSLDYAMDWEFWLRLLDAGCNFRRYREIGDILRAYSDWLHRNTSRLGFFHYDLANRPRSVVDDFFFWGLNGLLRPYELLKRPQRIRIRGLECWTNKVNKTCEVCLPRYSQQSPVEALILTDRALDLSIQLNKMPLESQAAATATTVFQGRRFKAHSYRAALPAVPGNLLQFHIESNSGPWRLLRLELN